MFLIKIWRDPYRTAGKKKTLGKLAEKTIQFTTLRENRKGGALRSHSPGKGRHQHSAASRDGAQWVWMPAISWGFLPQVLNEGRQEVETAKSWAKALIALPNEKRPCKHSLSVMPGRQALYTEPLSTLWPMKGLVWNLRVAMLVQTAGQLRCSFDSFILMAFYTCNIKQTMKCCWGSHEEGPNLWVRNFSPMSWNAALSLQFCFLVVPPTLALKMIFTELTSFLLEWIVNTTVAVHTEAASPEHGFFCECSMDECL